MFETNDVVMVEERRPSPPRVHHVSSASPERVTSGSDDDDDDEHHDDDPEINSPRSTKKHQIDHVDAASVIAQSWLDEVHDALARAATARGRRRHGIPFNTTTTTGNRDITTSPPPTTTAFELSSAQYHKDDSSTTSVVLPVLPAILALRERIHDVARVMVQVHHQTHGNDNRRVKDYVFDKDYDTTSTSNRNQINHHLEESDLGRTWATPSTTLYQTPPPPRLTHSRASCTPPAEPHPERTITTKVTTAPATARVEDQDATHENDSDDLDAILTHVVERLLLDTTVRVDALRSDPRLFPPSVHSSSSSSSAATAVDVDHDDANTTAATAWRQALHDTCLAAGPGPILAATSRVWRQWATTITGSSSLSAARAAATRATWHATLRLLHDVIRLPPPPPISAATTPEESHDHADRCWASREAPDSTDASSSWSIRDWCYAIEHATSITTAVDATAAYHREHDDHDPDNWINLLWSLPRILANASGALQQGRGRTRDFAAPQWTQWKPFSAQLMALASVLLTGHHRTKASLSDEKGHHCHGIAFDTTYPVMERMWAQLLRRLVRTTTGVEAVVAGLETYFRWRRPREQFSSLTEFLETTDPVVMALDRWYGDSTTTSIDRHGATALCAALLVQLARSKGASSSSLHATTPPRDLNYNNNDENDNDGPACRWWRACVAPGLADPGIRRPVLHTLVLRPTFHGMHGSSSRTKRHNTADHVVMDTLVKCLVQTEPVTQNSLRLVENHQDADDDSDTEDDDENDPHNSKLSGVRLHDYVVEVAHVWSAPVFVTHTDLLIQSRVTEFLLVGLFHLWTGNNATTHVLSSSVTEFLLEGTSERLRSSTTSVRIDGMRIAEALAQHLGQSLEFDELRSYRATLLSEGTSSVGTTSELKEANTSTNQTLAPAERDDDSDDSVWSDNDLGDAYHLDDEEDDLRPTPRPLFLQDCLNLLRATEDSDNAFSSHETALGTLPELIKSQPNDLPDVGSSLALELLRMENKFEIERFTEKVMASLIALAVHDPVNVGETLIIQMFEDGSLINRLCALSALSASAMELCGKKQLEDAHRLRLQHWKITADQPRITGKHAVIKGRTNEAAKGTALVAPQSIESRTTRWGRSGTRYLAPTVLSNQFINIGPLWFYSLVANFMRTKEKASIWGGSIGASLLTEFFVTLSILVECCGHSRGTNLLARDLFELVWGFRHADVADVRRAVLGSVAVSLSLLRQDDLMRLITGQSEPNLDHALRTLTTQDTDPTCRELAQAIQGTIKDQLKALQCTQNFLE